MSNTSLLLRAKTIAEVAHSGQYRSDQKEPYIEHCKRTALYVEHNFKRYATHETLAAAILHDSVEDATEPLDIYVRIYNECGPLVAGYVDILSKPTHAYFRNKRYFANLAIAPSAVLCIKLADRIDNLQDLNSSGWERKRILHYLEDSQIICEISESRLPEAYIQKLRDTIEKVTIDNNQHPSNES